MAWGDPEGIGPILEGLGGLVGIKKMSRRPSASIAGMPGAMRMPKMAEQEPMATFGMGHVPSPITEEDLAEYSRGRVQEEANFNQELQTLVAEGRDPMEMFARPEPPPVARQMSPAAKTLAQYAVQGDMPLIDPSAAGVQPLVAPDIRPLGSQDPNTALAYAESLNLLDEGAIETHEDAAAYARAVAETGAFVPDQDNYREFLKRERLSDEPGKTAKSLQYGLGRLRSGQATPGEAEAMYDFLPKRFQESVDTAFLEAETSETTKKEKLSLVNQMLWGALSTYLSPGVEATLTGVPLVEVFKANVPDLEASIGVASRLQGLEHKLSSSFSQGFVNVHGDIHAPFRAKQVHERLQGRGKTVQDMRTVLIESNPELEGKLETHQDVLREAENAIESGRKSHAELMRRAYWFKTLVDDGIDALTGEETPFDTKGWIDIPPLDVVVEAFMIRHGIKKEEDANKTLFVKRQKVLFAKLMVAPTREGRLSLQTQYFENFRRLYDVPRDAEQYFHRILEDITLLSPQRLDPGAEGDYPYGGIPDDITSMPSHMMGLMRLYANTRFVQNSSWNKYEWRDKRGNVQMPLRDNLGREITELAISIVNKQSSDDPNIDVLLSPYGRKLLRHASEKISDVYVKDSYNSYRWFLARAKFPHLKRLVSDQGIEFESSNMYRGFPLTPEATIKWHLRNKTQFSKDDYYSLGLTQSLDGMNAWLKANPENILNLPWFRTLQSAMHFNKQMATKDNPFRTALLRAREARMMRGDLTWGEWGHLQAATGASFAWHTFYGLMKITAEAAQNSARAAALGYGSAAEGLLGAIGEAADVYNLGDVERVAKNLEKDASYVNRLTLKTLNEDMEFAWGATKALGEHYFRMIDDPAYRSDQWHFQPGLTSFDIAVTAELGLKLPSAAMWAAEKSARLVARPSRVFTRFGSKLNRFELHIAKGYKPIQIWTVTPEGQAFKTIEIGEEFQAGAHITEAEARRAIPAVRLEPTKLPTGVGEKLTKPLAYLDRGASQILKHRTKLNHVLRAYSMHSITTKFMDGFQNWVAEGEPWQRALASFVLDPKEKLGRKMEMVLTEKSEQVNVSLYLAYDSLMEALAKVHYVNRNISVGEIARYLGDAFETTGVDLHHLQSNVPRIIKRTLKDGTKEDVNLGKYLEQIYKEKDGFKVEQMLSDEGAVIKDALTVKFTDKSGKTSTLTFGDVYADMKLMMDISSEEVLQNTKFRMALINPNEKSVKALISGEGISGKKARLIMSLRKDIMKSKAMRKLLANEESMKQLLNRKPMKQLGEMWDYLVNTHSKIGKARIDQIVVRLRQGEKIFNVKLVDFEAAFTTEKGGNKAWTFLYEYVRRGQVLEPKDITWTVKTLKGEEKFSAVDLGFVRKQGDQFVISEAARKLLWERDAGKMMNIEQVGPQRLMTRIRLVDIAMGRARKNMNGIFTVGEKDIIALQEMAVGKEGEFLPFRDLSPEEILREASRTARSAKRSYTGPEVAGLYEELGLQKGAVFAWGPKTGGRGRSPMDVSFIVNLLTDFGPGAKKPGQRLGSVARQLTARADVWRKARGAKKPYTRKTVSESNEALFEHYELASQKAKSAEFSLKYANGENAGKFVTVEDVIEALRKKAEYAAEKKDGTVGKSAIQRAYAKLEKELLAEMAKKKAKKAKTVPLKDGRNRTKRFSELLMSELGIRSDGLGINWKIEIPKGHGDSMTKAGNLTAPTKVDIGITSKTSVFDAKEHPYARLLWDAVEDGTAWAAMNAEDAVRGGAAWAGSVNDPALTELILDMEARLEQMNLSRNAPVRAKAFNLLRSKKNPVTAITSGFVSMDVHAAIALWEYLKTGKMPEGINTKHGTVMLEQWQNAGFWKAVGGNLVNGELTSLGTAATFVKADMSRGFYRSFFSRILMDNSRAVSGPGSNFFNVRSMLPEHLHGLAFALEDPINDLHTRAARRISTHFASGLYEGNPEAAGRSMRYLHSVFEKTFEEIVMHIDPTDNFSISAVLREAKQKNLPEAMRGLTQTAPLSENYFFAMQMTWGAIENRLAKMDILLDLWKDGHIAPGLMRDVGKTRKFAAPGSSLDWIRLDMKTLGLGSEEEFLFGGIWGKEAEKSGLYIRRYAAEAIGLADQKWWETWKLAMGNDLGPKGGLPGITKIAWAALGRSLSAALEAGGDAGDWFNKKYLVQVWKTNKLMRAGLAPISRNAMTNMVLLAREYPELIVSKQFYKDMFEYLRVRQGLFDPGPGLSAAERAVGEEIARTFTATGIGAHAQTRDMVAISKFPVTRELEALWEDLINRGRVRHKRHLAKTEIEESALSRSDIESRTEKDIRYKEELDLLYAEDFATDMQKNYIEMLLTKYGGGEFGAKIADSAIGSKFTSSAQFVTDMAQYFLGLPMGGKVDPLTQWFASMFTLVDEAPKYALYKHLWRTKGPAEAARVGNFKLGTYGKGTWDDFRNAPEPWRKAEVDRYSKSKWLSPFDIREAVGELLTDYTRASSTLRFARGFINPFSFFIWKVSKALGKYYAQNPIRARAQQEVGSLLYSMQFDTPEEMATLNGIHPDEATVQWGTPLGMMNMRYLTGMFDPNDVVKMNEWFGFQATNEIYKTFTEDRGAMMGDKHSIEMASLRLADSLSRFWLGSNQFSLPEAGARRVAISGLEDYDENWVFPGERPSTLLRSGQANIRHATGHFYQEPVRSTERGLQLAVPDIFDLASRLLVGVSKSKPEKYYAASRQLRQSKESQRLMRKAITAGKTPIQALSDIETAAIRTKGMGLQEMVDAPAHITEIPTTLQQRVQVKQAFNAAKRMAEHTGRIDIYTKRELAASGFLDVMKYLPYTILANQKTWDWVFEQDPGIYRDLARSGIIQLGTGKEPGGAMKELYKDTMTEEQLRDIPQDPGNLTNWFLKLMD